MRTWITWSSFNQFERVSPLRSLHGDYTTYGKLLIPSLIDPKVQWCLYIDADVIVNVDLELVLENAIRSCNESGVGFCAVNGGFVKSSLDRELYLEAGLHDESRVFNAGVMFFNLQVLRELRLLDRLMKSGKRLG